MYGQKNMLTFGDALLSNSLFKCMGDLLIIKMFKFMSDLLSICFN